MRLPGICSTCREPVFWNGISWRRPENGKRHVCRADRASCGAWMPRAKDHCARQPLHNYECRTRYALENAARSRRSGWAA